MPSGSGSREGDRTSRLAVSLGINVADLAALRELVIETLSPLGLDGSAVFARLADGGSFGEALGVSAGVIELIYARAHQWFAVGQTERAEALFEALCVLAPASADHWVGYGVCLKARSALQEAAQAFDRAAELRPEWAIPRFHATEVAVLTGAWAAAADALTAFEYRVAADVPPAMIREMARVRAAISARGGAEAGALAW
jgi:tetratricopeptide (TPR) repeat protein